MCLWLCGACSTTELLVCCAYSGAWLDLQACYDVCREVNIYVLLYAK